MAKEFAEGRGIAGSWMNRGWVRGWVRVSVSADHGSALENGSVATRYFTLHGTPAMSTHASPKSIIARGRCFRVLRGSFSSGYGSLFMLPLPR